MAAQSNGAYESAGPQPLTSDYNVIGRSGATTLRAALFDQQGRTCWEGVLAVPATAARLEALTGTPDSGWPSQIPWPDVTGACLEAAAEVRFNTSGPTGVMPTVNSVERILTSDPTQIALVAR